MQVTVFIQVWHYKNKQQIIRLNLHSALKLYIFDSDLLCISVKYTFKHYHHQQPYTNES